MSTKETGNLGLHSWEPFDVFRREEFNENFDKIDAAVESDRKGIAAAQSAADKAQSTANTAQSAANAAQSSANTAQSAAQKAQSTAETEAAAIRAALGSGGHTCRIAYGTYTGDGKFSSSNIKTLNFDFKPLAVFVSCNIRYVLLVRPCDLAYPTSDNYYVTITWGDRSVSWYAPNAATHMNTNNTQFQYFAIGYEE